jgi:hypothetical protein
VAAVAVQARQAHRVPGRLQARAVLVAPILGQDQPGILRAVVAVHLTVEHPARAVQAAAVMVNLVQVKTVRQIPVAARVQVAQVQAERVVRVL